MREHIPSRIPEHITRERLVAAIGAFCGALDLDAGEMYFPLHIGENEISFPLIVRYREDGGRVFPGTSDRDECDAFDKRGLPVASSLAVPVEIKVVG